MPRAAALAVLLLLLAACASAPPYLEPARRDGALGKSKAEILAAFGQPQETVAAEGVERLVYVYDRVVLYGPSGPAIATAYYCHVTFVLAGGRVTAVETSGPDCDL